MTNKEIKQLLKKIRKEHKKKPKKISLKYFYRFGSGSFMYGFFNSGFWFDIYYKHTKKHKLDIKNIRDEVLKHRFEIIGK